MARLDIFANPYPEDRSHTPFVVDVQNEHLGPLATRVVIPLRTMKSFKATAGALNPVVEVQGRSLVLDTASLAPVPRSMLRSVAGRADAARTDIIDALDTLFGSY